MKIKKISRNHKDKISRLAREFAIQPSGMAVVGILPKEISTLPNTLLTAKLRNGTNLTSCSLRLVSRAVLLHCCCSTESSEFVQIQRAQNCTYRSEESPWLEKELPHLLSMQRNVTSGVVLTRGNWSWNAAERSHYQLHGFMKFVNVTKRNEIFVNEVSGSAILLSDSRVDQILTSIKILPRHPDNIPAARKDGYWPACILKPGRDTQIEVLIDIKSPNGVSLHELHALRLEVNFVSYGPCGRFIELQHVILPLQYAFAPQLPVWQQTSDGGAVLPVRTHILCHMDDPVEVLKMYAISQAMKGDTIVIGETPLAIMQGRFRHPYNISPSLFAKLACRLFHRTSSLATACGMQALLDIIGKLRALLAIFIAVIARFVGIRGMFYQLAGEQARLIDDVTGTLPPYDQFICLGPVNAKDIVDRLQQVTGYGVAIVDANNIKGVHILAASNKVDSGYLKKALVTNPAGNEDEQTPLVIVRPPTTSSG